MLWIRLFLPFAGAYFLSYHFRTANAVVGPVLSADLGLGAADLGLLTSAYFLAFATTQLPLGIALDRFGPRRVEAALLVIAAAGSAVFALGDSITALATGRALIGFGVSACLMGTLKAFAQWYPKEQMASLTGWIMTAGTLGALVASTPLDAALQFAGWRQIFLGLALATLMMAAWIFFAVPDRPAAGKSESLSEQLAGIRYVLGNAHFWRFAPLGLFQIGGFMAVQSLWSSAWLMNVNGYSRSIAADHLAAMSVAMLVAYALIGLLATRLAERGIPSIRLLGGGMVLALISMFLIISEAIDQHYLLWIAYGAFSSCGTLTYAQLAAGFPLSLSGRASTTLNLLVFVGAFGLQWGMGVMIDLLRDAGFTVQMAHRNAFAALFVLQAAACLWLFVGNRGRATVRQPG